jgi:O-antigen/teichoic acid export membrane protein
VTVASYRRHRDDHRGAEPNALAVGEYAPVGLGILLSALYFRSDVYFVEWWHGLEAVGIYNGAFRLVDAVRLFPAALLAVQYPLMCRATDLRPLRGLVAGLAAAGGLAACATYAGAESLLATLYGDRFIDAAPALQMLAFAVPLFFINYGLTHQVIAWDGQRAYLLIAAAALVANVAGNVTLIPQGGIWGAALATTLTEIVVTCGCGYVLLAGRSSSPLLRRAEAA